MEPHKLISEILKSIVPFVEPGITLRALDSIAEKKLAEVGALSYNKGYKPEWAKTMYPATTCLSVNSQIAHGVPDEYRLQNGDVLNIDLGVIALDGQCGDAALTVPVGNISDENARLLKYAKMALYEGIKVVRPNMSVFEIGKAIEFFATRMGYAVNKSLVGHGIGSEMHQNPTIFHFDVERYMSDEERAKYAYNLQIGDIICIEPMLTFNDDRGTLSPNGWTYYTRDGRNSAMFEHMVKVTETGYEVLTDHISQDAKKNRKTNSKKTPSRSN